VDKYRLTQVGRALKELSVPMIPAYSPQARGRSERSFGTWQGRLPQELRLAGITTREEANRFLRDHYMAEFNASVIKGGWVDTCGVDASDVDITRDLFRDQSPPVPELIFAEPTAFLGTDLTKLPASLSAVSKTLRRLGVLRPSKSSAPDRSRYSTKTSRPQSSDRADRDHNRIGTEPPAHHGFLTSIRLQAVSFNARRRSRR